MNIIKNLNKRLKKVNKLTNTKIMQNTINNRTNIMRDFSVVPPIEMALVVFC